MLDIRKAIEETINKYLLELSQLWCSYAITYITMPMSHPSLGKDKGNINVKFCCDHIIMVVASSLCTE